jgi:hypothetical protein
MLRLTVVLMLMVVLLSAAVFVLLPGPRSNRPASATPKAASSPLDLPPANECPALNDRERMELAERLQVLGTRWHIALPEGTSEEQLSASLATVDKRLGTPYPRRNPGPLRYYGPSQRQLRVLLWKHGVAEYGDRRLNVMELLERLRKRVDRERNPANQSGD